MTGVNWNEGTDKQYFYRHRSGVVNKPATSRYISTARMNHDYDLGYFLCVRAEDESDAILFWVGRVVDVHFGERQLVDEITVNWYEF